MKLTKCCRYTSHRLRPSLNLNYALTKRAAACYGKQKIIFKRTVDVSPQFVIDRKEFELDVDMKRCPQKSTIKSYMFSLLAVLYAFDASLAINPM
jgi:hypothetical protein